ncbi:hypothetical protein SDC9_154689 [bioreactor metagenome]|uniref:Uncharacterized protein n=1 Tax=bioreactor metagenome TaxID=1076179 RepID=A0A645F1W4_9ZZZZ
MPLKEEADMDHEEILQYCLSKPGAFYVVSLDGTVSGVDIIRMIGHACQAVVSRMRGIARRELEQKAREA